MFSGENEEWEVLLWGNLLVEKVKGFVQKSLPNKEAFSEL